MSWKNIIPKLAIILPLTFFLNITLFEGFYITSVVLLFFLIKIIARAQPEISAKYKKITELMEYVGYETQ